MRAYLCADGSDLLVRKINDDKGKGLIVESVLEVAGDWAGEHKGGGGHCPFSKQGNYDVI